MPRDLRVVACRDHIVDHVVESRAHAHGGGYVVRIRDVDNRRRQAVRAPSIMQDEKRCIVTGCEIGLDCHHIYFGNPNRRISDEHGFWVWIRHDVHMRLHDRRPPYERLDGQLKRLCQAKFEESGGTRDEFIALIGRNYL